MPLSATRHGLAALLAAQFLSALADNALLIVAIALLQDRGLPPWWAPLLKIGFNLAYVLLAPLVGPLADGRCKARWMGWMNGLKLAGAGALLLGLDPVAAFAIVGLGAAAYAPAKYGLLTELVPPAHLVQANAWLEVSVVAAALLGAVLGGALVHPALLHSAPALALQQGLQAWLSPLQLWTGDRVAPALALLLPLYGLAGLANLAVPASGARYPQTAALHPRALWRDFRSANRRLWADGDGGLSLAVTTLFWGLGATLQLAVLRWSEQVLGLTLSQAAPLQAAIGLGVVLGAWAAGRWVPLAAARRMLGCGVLLGLLMPLLAQQRSLPLVAALLVLAGAVGGLMVVPLNALLQHRGHQLLSAGRSIAVQGFNENASVLAMLGVYALLLHAGLDIARIITLFGLGIAAAMAWLAWRAPGAAGRVSA
ncbi:MAG: lysophospholipid transporter LplT [Burkholderiaceae bacterium]|nr:lysophospholipid transporter LplT [Burkholderiaceae bacterium]